MEPTDDALYDQLLGYLAADGAVAEDTVHGSVTLSAYDHRPLLVPLRLHITPASFGEHLRTTASDAAPVFPDVTPVEAAWRLFLVHFDEAVQTAEPDETELVLDGTGVVSRWP